MGTERKTWIDVARGAAIILVTLFHATFITQGAFGPGTGVWPEVNEALVPVRMPLFFFVSGLLAATAVRKPLALTRRRTLGFAYLYLLWTTIQVLLDLHLASVAGAPRPPASTIVLTMVLPTGLWFLWALAVYFIIARALVVLLRRSAAWGLVPALALAAILPLIDESTAAVVDPFFGVGFFGSVCANFVWFYAGLFARGWVIARSARPSPLVAGLGVVAYVVLYLVADLAGAVYEGRWLLSIVALWASVNALVLIRGSGRVTRMLAAVGRRTLPVYVMQWAALFALSKVLLEQPLLVNLLEAVGHPDLLASVAGPVIAAVVVAATWWIGGMIQRGPFRWLLEAPAWLVESRRPPVGDQPEVDAEASQSGAAGVRG